MMKTCAVALLLLVALVYFAERTTHVDKNFENVNAKLLHPNLLHVPWFQHRGLACCTVDVPVHPG
jgi:hypothetical protein